MLFFIIMLINTSTICFAQNNVSLDNTEMNTEVYILQIDHANAESHNLIDTQNPYDDAQYQYDYAENLYEDTQDTYDEDGISSYQLKVAATAVSLSSTPTSISISAVNVGHNENVRCSGYVRVWSGSTYRDLDFEIYTKGLYGPTLKTWNYPAGWTKVEILTFNSQVINPMVSSSVTILIGNYVIVNPGKNVPPYYPEN